ncbi:TrmH family RNA methyltransferase [Leptospira sp. 96542]|nr:TrmH family RNA methyltransferase [Leptospira sp. 96542]
MKISTENAEFQILSALKSNRTKRSQTNEVFVEGTESIKQLIRANWEITRIVFLEGKKLSDWAESILKRYSHVRRIRMSENIFTKLSEKENPAELILTAKIKTHTLEGVEYKKNPVYLLFDRPSDLGNFGSILRTADAFGISAVFVMGHSIDVYDPKVIRSSLGSLFHTKLILIKSTDQLENFIQAEKIKNGLFVVGSDSTGKSTLGHIELCPPILIILGNEAKGMSVYLQSICDEIVNIPMFGTVNSLNVASAGSILLWEAVKNINPSILH